MNYAIRDCVSIMRDDWNRRAKEDPYYYASFVSPNHSEDWFQNSATNTIREIEGEFHRLVCLGEGVGRRRALEVGCGPGRLVLALSRHFDEIYGVDISEEMIDIARDHLRSVPNAHVLVNNGCDLAAFEGNHFSFVYSYTVFQHIPSKEIVLNYLREIKRVLIPGGIVRFQVRAVPHSRASLEVPNTWNGYVLLESDIVEFAHLVEMELVGLSGEHTEYMWVTLRKAPAPSLDAVTSTSGANSVPQRGTGAAISLWVRNAPSGADLTSLSVQINGELVRAAYLSPIGLEGGCQMNVILPRNLPIGDVNVALVHRGKVLAPARVIIIQPAPNVPRVTSVYDAKNIAMQVQTESGGLKVLIEDLIEPTGIKFQIGSRVVEDVGVTSINPVLDQYLFSFLLPRGVEDGVHPLSIFFWGHVVYEADLQVRLAVESEPVLDAVTSAASASTTVSQRGPGAAISLWIRNAPNDADLTSLSAQINGQPVQGTYLSPITVEGACQMDVTLPRNITAGTAYVALLRRGEVVGRSRSITILPTPFVPRVIAVYDAKNVAVEMRSESGGLTVLMEDTADPGAILFQLADKAVKEVEIACTNPIFGQYSFSFHLPPEIDKRQQTLTVYFLGRIVYQSELDIRLTE